MGVPSGGSSIRRPVSEDPHRCQRNFFQSSRTLQPQFFIKFNSVKSVAPNLSLNSTVDIFFNVDGVQKYFFLDPFSFKFSVCIFLIEWKFKGKWSRKINIFGPHKHWTMKFKLKFGPTYLTELNFMENCGRTALLFWERKKWRFTYDLSILQLVCNMSATLTKARLAPGSCTNRV